MRVTEVHRNARAFARLFVHRHLPILVVRQALEHGRGDTQQLVREGLHHIDRAGGIELGPLDEHGQPAGALDQGANRAGVGRTLYEVALPVAGELTILNLRRAQMDAHDVRDLTLEHKE